MNCKENDMAVVVRLPSGGDGSYRRFAAKLLGAVVTVTTVSQVDEKPVWTIKEPIWTTFCGRPCEVTGIEDCLLQPIRGDATGDPARVKTNIPEAVSMAWGIHAPVLS